MTATTIAVSEVAVAMFPATACRDGIEYMKLGEPEAALVGPTVRSSIRQICRAPTWYRLILHAPIVPVEAGCALALLALTLRVQRDTSNPRAAALS